MHPVGVRRHVARLLVPFATNGALERSLSRVNSRVLREPARRRESPAADATRVRSVSAVRPAVHEQVGRLGEPLSAEGALVRRLAGVDSLVLRQRAELHESFSARAALVRSLAAVNSAVHGQLVRRRERLVTDGTPKRRLSSHVDANVTIQLRRLTEGLVTQQTFVRFLSAVNSAVHAKAG